MKIYVNNDAKYGFNPPKEEVTLAELKEIQKGLSCYGHCEITEWTDEEIVFWVWEE